MYPIGCALSPVAKTKMEGDVHGYSFNCSISFLKTLIVRDTWLTGSICEIYSSNTIMGPKSGESAINPKHP